MMYIYAYTKRAKAADHVIYERKPYSYFVCAKTTSMVTSSVTS